MLPAGTWRLGGTGGTGTVRSCANCARAAESNARASKPAAVTVRKKAIIKFSFEQTFCFRHQRPEGDIVSSLSGFFFTTAQPLRHFADKRAWPRNRKASRLLCSAAMKLGSSVKLGSRYGILALYSDLRNQAQILSEHRNQRSDIYACNSMKHKMISYASKNRASRFRCAATRLPICHLL